MQLGFWSQSWVKAITVSGLEQDTVLTVSLKCWLNQPQLTLRQYHSLPCWCLMLLMSQIPHLVWAPCCCLKKLKNKISFRHCYSILLPWLHEITQPGVRLLVHIPSPSTPFYHIPWPEHETCEMCWKFELMCFEKVQPFLLVKSVKPCKKCLTLYLQLHEKMGFSIHTCKTCTRSSGMQKYAVPLTWLKYVKYNVYFHATDLYHTNAV